MKNSGWWVLVSVLGSCALSPEYRRPDNPVPGGFVDSAAREAVAQAGGLLDWRGFFCDATLRGLIELALRENRDLRVAMLKVEQLRLQHQISQAEARPSVDAAGAITRQKSASLPDARSQGSVQVSVAYEIDLFGRVKSSSRQALEQFFATEQGRMSAQLALVAQVASQYLQWREADDLRELARQTWQARQDQVTLYRKQHAAGEMAEVDLRAAEADAASAQVQVLIQEQNQRTAEQALMELVGAPLPKNWAGQQSKLDHVLRPVPVGLKSDLLLRRPDVLQAEHELKASVANIGVARAALFPSIRLTSAGSLTSPQLSELLSGQARVWSIAPQLDFPLFDAGQRRNQVKVAENQSQQRVASYQRLLQQAFREVNQALVARANDAQQLELLAQIVELQGQRLKLAQLRYQRGEDSYLQVLSAQQQLLNAQQQEIQTRHRRARQEVSLYQALGGGWK